MRSLEFIKEKLSKNSKIQSDEPFMPTPKVLTTSDEHQIADLQKLLPEGREFMMYEDAVIQVNFSARLELTGKRIATLKDHGFSLLTQYNCKCCTDYVFILTKEF